MFINLGPKNTPLDLRQWDAHCLLHLGHTVPIKEKSLFAPGKNEFPRLTTEESAKLGFMAASKSSELRKLERKMK